MGCSRSKDCSPNTTFKNHCWHPEGISLAMGCYHKSCWIAFVHPMLSWKATKLHIDILCTIGERRRHTISSTWCQNLTYLCNFHWYPCFMSPCNARVPFTALIITNNQIKKFFSWIYKIPLLMDIKHLFKKKWS